MPSQKIDGFLTHWRTSGPADGKPVLLFHAFPLSSEAFAPQLDAAPPGIRYICPDHRGFGGSALRPGVATMEELARDGLRVLDTLNIGTAVVGGVSMGGYAAMALLRLDPSRVKGLVLMDTQAGADDAAANERREAMAADLEKNGIGGLVAMLPKLIAADSKPFLRARVEAMIRATNPAAAAAATRGMGQREDSRELLQRFGGPALVIVGEKDEITPVAKANELAALLSGVKPVVVVPGVGHLANLEAPGVVNEALAGFLTGLA